MQATGLTAVDAAAGRYALTGPAGFQTATALLPAGVALFRPHGTVEIDLKDVNPVDSAGLALLICWLSRARTAGCALRYTNVPAALRAIARISDAEALIDGGV